MLSRRVPGCFMVIILPCNHGILSLQLKMNFPSVSWLGFAFLDYRELFTKEACFRKLVAWLGKLLGLMFKPTKVPGDSWLDLWFKSI